MFSRFRRKKQKKKSITAAAGNGLQQKPEIPGRKQSSPPVFKLDPNPDIESILDESQLEHMLKDALEHTALNGQMVIFAGAGVSMDAPSCSPSWWGLMIDTLKSTFRGVPESYFNNPDMLDKISASAIRQPEEIMETFYFYLEDELFTLFGSLEAGEPNANHMAIAHLAKQGKVRAIVTTNFDTFIERALLSCGVEFIVLRSTADFERYDRDVPGKKVVVLKIHGSTDEANTIVAVANHYKTGKGFSPIKASVLSKLMASHPIVFTGYSGWDFQHANYKAFWEQVGDSGLCGVFWLGFAKDALLNGPPLLELVSSRIHHQMWRGVGDFTSLASQLLEDFVPGASQPLTHFVAEIDKETSKQMVERKQKQYISNWVDALPDASNIAIVFSEASSMDPSTQYVLTMASKVQRNAQSSQGLQEEVMKLNEQFAKQEITLEEFNTQINEITARYTLWSVPLLEHIRVELTDAVIGILNVSALDPDARSKVRKLMQLEEHDDLADMVYTDDAARRYLPTWVQCTCYSTDINDTVSSIFRKMMPRLMKLGALKMETGDEAEIRVQFMELCMFYALRRLGSDDIQDRVDQVVETWVAKAMEEKWDLMKRAEMTRHVIYDASQVVETVDLWELIESMVKACLATDNDDDFAKNALVIPLAILSKSPYLAIRFHRDTTVHLMSDLQMILQSIEDGTSSEEPSTEQLQQIENLVFMECDPILERLNKIGTKDAELAKAAFVVAKQKVWVTMNIASYAVAEQSARSGIVPRTTIKKGLATYIEANLEGVRDQVLNEQRVAQEWFAMWTILGSTKHDIKMLEFAAKESLKLTGGLATERTPPGIPEDYACMLAEQGKHLEASKMFLIGLHGLESGSCLRNTIECIVNQAATLEKELYGTRRAMELVFRFSPDFGNAIQLTSAGLIPGAREFTKALCEEWASSSGYESVEQAYKAFKSR